MVVQKLSHEPNGVTAQTRVIPERKVSKFVFARVAPRREDIYDRNVLDRYVTLFNTFLLSCYALIACTSRYCLDLETYKCPLPQLPQRIHRPVQTYLARLIPLSSDTTCLIRLVQAEGFLLTRGVDGSFLFLEGG